VVVVVVVMMMMMIMMMMIMMMVVTLVSPAPPCLCSWLERSRSRHEDLRATLEAALADGRLQADIGEQVRRGIGGVVIMNRGGLVMPVVITIGHGGIGSRLFTWHHGQTRLYPYRCPWCRRVRRWVRCCTRWRVVVMVVMMLGDGDTGEP
jgi:hypothetical protein